MSRPSSVTIGRGGESVHVEYVKTRSVLRLRGGDNGRGSPAVFEVPLEELARAFDLGLHRSDRPARFLLFGGSSPQSCGGSADLLASYVSQEEARREFQRLRRSADWRGGWAELVVADASRRQRRLCWFGSPARSGYPAASRRRLSLRRLLSA
jgi:hypothetical protein